MKSSQLRPIFKKGKHIEFDSNLSYLIFQLKFVNYLFLNKTVLKNNH